MFELVQVTGVFQELLSSQAPVAHGVSQYLNDVGVFAGATQGIDAGQIEKLISQSGTDLTQLDADQFQQIIERYGVELPQDWTLPNFTDPAA